MKLKKILSAVTASVLACSFGFASLACGGEETPWNPPANEYEYEIPQDYYRTYYEVFVRSFADSDGDKIGDLRGLANNLDYLNDGDDSTMTDLGINGIWLMPINMSPSYHKYDVSDYYDIDDEYGTMEDFEYLVQECNKRDIWIQMDLVLNHTSTKNQWFLDAVADAKKGLSPRTSKAMSYYNFVNSSTNPSSTQGGQWNLVSGTSNYWYLCNFSTEMPDLNLSNVLVRNEIEKIVDFWLEKGVKSFRLDAVPWAYANSSGDYNNESNFEFWTWFNDYCNKKGAQVATDQGWADESITSYCYNVGEVWSNASTVTNFFSTGMSNFNYSMAANPQGGFAGAVNSYVRASTIVENLASYQASSIALDSDAILSNFLSNHDNDRSGGYFQGKAERIKMAAGLYLLAPGNPYIYYGEEIGALGSGDNDPNKRLAFNWGDSRTVNNPPLANFEEKQTFGTVKAQTHSESSILSYYREAIRLRNRFPEIARGIITPYCVNASGAIDLTSAVRATIDSNTSLTTVNSFNWGIAVYKLTWDNRDVLIVQNVGENEGDDDAILGLGAFANYDVVGTLSANGKTVEKTEDGKLSIPVGTVAVLKAA